MQLVCQPNLLNRHSFSQQGIDELSEILTVQKNEGRWCQDTVLLDQSS